MSTRDDVKYLEQRLMDLLDQYAELARELGSPCDGWFGDPLENHKAVIRRARHLVNNQR